MPSTVPRGIKSRGSWAEPVFDGNATQAKAEDFFRAFTVTTTNRHCAAFGGPDAGDDGELSQNASFQLVPPLAHPDRGPSSQPGVTLAPTGCGVVGRIHAACFPSSGAHKHIRKPTRALEKQTILY